MTPLVLFCTALLVSLACTALVKTLAQKAEIVDRPDGVRKLHATPTPLLGGFALYAAFTLVVIGYILLHPGNEGALWDSHVPPAQLVGILVGGLLLMIGGYCDDRYRLTPIQQIIWPLLATAALMASGIAAQKLTNPFGGLIDLTQILPLRLNGVLVTSGASLLFTFLWMMTVIYTTKFLDGLDGLVSGITAIGALIIGILSTFFFINTPTAYLAFIAAGSFVGFLVFNFYPARIFLGESGSTFAGFLLGVLALMSGAKVATALLVLGIPVLDAAWVIIQRITSRTSPFKGDRRHIHFRLLDRGYSQQQAVALLYALSATFGVAALFLQSKQKLLALGSLVVVMAITSIITRKKGTNHANR